MISDDIKATGALHIQLFDKSGAPKDSMTVKNLVVSLGKEFIAARMVSTPSVMSHMAIGASSTAAALGDTALGSELGRVSFQMPASSAGAVVTYTALFGPGVGTGGVVEAGILNAASSGTLLCRTVFPVVNKGADDTMAITWTVTVS
jgi:hypothetical protein